MAKPTRTACRESHVKSENTLSLVVLVRIVGWGV